MTTDRAHLNPGDRVVHTSDPVGEAGTVIDVDRARSLATVVWDDGYTFTHPTHLLIIVD